MARLHKKNEPKAIAVSRSAGALPQGAKVVEVTPGREAAKTIKDWIKAENWPKDSSNSDVAINNSTQTQTQTVQGDSSSELSL